MDENSLGLLAIRVTRGTSNNLFQVATLVRAATALEVPVRVFFQDNAACKLARERINVDEWSAIYEPVRELLTVRLRAADFVDMESFLRDAKEHGDDVRFWVSQEALTAHGLSVGALTAIVDGAMSADEFVSVVRDADISLTF